MAKEKIAVKTREVYKKLKIRGSSIPKNIKKKPLPKWLTTFSNKILPPIFFLLLAILTIHYIPYVSSIPLRINLGVVSVASSTLSLYLATIML